MDATALARRLRAPLTDGPSPRTLARLLLERRGAVHAPPAARPAGTDTAPLVAEAAALGYALDAALLRRLQDLPAAAGEALLQDLRALTGADRPHETLPARLVRRAAELLGAPPRPEPAPPPADAPPTTVLALCVDPQAALRELAAAWLASAAPLRPDELADLGHVFAFDPDLGLLPEVIPARAVRAFALARLEPAAPGEAWEAWSAEVRRRLDTGTDLLRLLAAREGADPMLTARPSYRALPRRLRRLALAHLDGLRPAALIEDMRRRPVDFQRLGEHLHPFEEARRAPRAGLAFAWLRGTRLVPGKRLGDALLPRVPEVDGLSVEGERLVFQGWGSSLERALAASDGATALTVASQRPGELLRRTDHLLRVGAPLEAARAALEAAAPKVSPAVLVTGLGHFPSRRHPLARRVFLPQSSSALPWGIPDARPPLSDAAVAAAAAPITAELLARAADLPRVDLAVLDEELRDLMVPTGEATASAQLVQLPRGSARPLPEGDALRLFLHWMEPEGQRTDLDLSVAFFDAAWKPLGHCDYTQLEYKDGAATHSGDQTSAPAPEGATEFLDLEIPALLAAGVRYLSAAIFCFNAVPFETLPEAFAGFAIPPDHGGHEFQAAAVRQRFDLTGSALVAVPMLVDLVARRLRWIDLHLTSRSGLHSVDGNRRSLARIGEDAESLYGSGCRTTMWQLGAVHAAARAREVLVRDGQGALNRYRRRADEDPVDFYTRLTARGPGEGPGEPPPRDATVFAALVRADLPLPAASEVYALHPQDVPATATRRRAADLASLLVPRA